MSSAAVRIVNPLWSAFAAAPKVRVCSSPLRYAAPSWNAFYNTRRGFSQSAFCQAKKYTEQHEWVELSADNTTATVGITHYAAKSLGDVVFVELPAVESEVSSGETIGAVESVKSASDIMSPVSGTVVETNTALEEKPKIVNDSPEADGWFVKIKVTDQTELEGLMNEAAYKASLEEEE
ncbi:glycine cleavage system H-protein subunit [Coccidioides posadasii str. Silveira]|uniref:Glycine cleavage system H protein n=1 Tax=Coccidioides posadasii (strain RMSCC 757 / Silveira) TaxID=443226 RepID=E9CV31_COCPS|nr:glycine cleavage system H protein [Coccidioides posadasii str. Silveira]QVM12818.1 glycine cleavage system H-protein subunit [Coccidioides posadasii str. Silveira]